MGETVRPLSEAAIHNIAAKLGSESLNVTRAHELFGPTRTILDDEGVIEFARAIEMAHGIYQHEPSPAKARNHG